MDSDKDNESKPAAMTPTSTILMAPVDMEANTPTHSPQQLVPTQPPGNRADPMNAAPDRKHRKKRLAWLIVAIVVAASAGVAAWWCWFGGSGWYQATQARPESQEAACEFATTPEDLASCGTAEVDRLKNTAPPADAPPEDRAMHFALLIQNANAYDTTAAVSYYEQAQDQNLPLDAQAHLDGAFALNAEGRHDDALAAVQHARDYITSQPFQPPNEYGDSGTTYQLEQVDQQARDRGIL